MTVRIMNGDIIDGFHKEPCSNPGIWIDDGKIQRIGKLPHNERADMEIDATGMTILPGLIDAHLHLLGVSSLDFSKVLLTEPAPLRAIRAAKDAEQLLQMGYTTVRCAGSDVSLAIRRAIQEGRVNGPTVLSAGSGISQTGGHGDRHDVPLAVLALFPSIMRLADGAEECRKAVREQLRENVDFIKICTTGGIISENDEPSVAQFTEEEVLTITKEAHRWGRHVASHAESVPGIRLAVECGVDTIEHGMLLDEETCTLLAKKNIPIVTTFTICELAGEMLLAQKLTHQFEKLQKIKATYGENIQMARRMGVSIATGTDMVGPAPLTHGENALEMVLLQKLAAMTPMEAVQAATSDAAKAIGIGEKTGSIRENYDADLLIMKKNPIEELAFFLESENIAYVFKKGLVAHINM